MNIQIGDKGIGWTDATWNPITGCLHNCPYCYARTIANRYRRSFKPEFHAHLLDDPIKRKKPTKIFCGSTADNFGDWVPSEWMNAVLDIVRQCPQHTFQFLTKAPQNLAQYNPWPSNCWVGASATDQQMMDKALKTLTQCDAPIKFVSAEPLLSLIDADLSPLDWIIIGAQTGKNAHQPDQWWTLKLIHYAAKARIPIFHKDNLIIKPKRREFPRAQAQPALFVL